MPIINTYEMNISKKKAIAKVTAWPDDEIQIEVVARDGIFSLDQATTLAENILAAVEQSKKLEWVETKPDEYTLALRDD